MNELLFKGRNFSDLGEFFYDDAELAIEFEDIKHCQPKSGFRCAYIILLHVSVDL